MRNFRMLKKIPLKYFYVYGIKAAPVYNIYRKSFNSFHRGMFGLFGCTDME